MKILIADDHTLFRDSLVHYITRTEPHSHAMVAADFYEAERLLKMSQDQDVVLLDLKMPGMNGLEGLRQIRRDYPRLRVVLMSGMAEKDDVKAAIEMGAAGYFPKTLSGKELMHALSRVIHGEVYIPFEENSGDVKASYYGDEKKADGPSGRDLDAIGLTPREKGVLGYLMTGASNKDIANTLKLQVVTIKLHVRGICRKLDAKNRTHAVIKAREMGFMKE